MKEWLKNKVPFRLKLALKRQAQRVADLNRKKRWTKDLAEVPPLNFDHLRQGLASLPPPAQSPERAVRVSIIIPVFNKAQFTAECLRSVLAEVDLNDTEIIVVNNGSTDETIELLAVFENYVTVVNNDENRGFVEASNQGAAVARGEFLVFLNNDTIVLPGWLSALVETLEADPNVGVVGSLFMYPSGKLQEAGSFVWSNGEAFHYGWGRSPDDHQFNFARDVDYCSGASLLIRKSLFDQLKGFDTRYAPAYYEDVDLCFAARFRGYRVVFQPASKIIHYEGITAGPDINSGVKRYELINRQKFCDKWKEVLERDHLANKKENIYHAAHRLPKKSIMLFDDRIPTPDLDSGSVRMLAILKLLRKHYRVLFIYQRPPTSPNYEQALWKEAIETAKITAYLQLMKREDYRVAIISRPDLAHPMLPLLRNAAPRMKIIYDTVDAHYRRFQRQFELTNDPEVRRKVEHYRKIEMEVVSDADMVWCTSAEDQDAVLFESPNRPVTIIPNIHSLHQRGGPFDERRDLLFIGNFNHTPNQDAVEFFVDRVWPLILNEISDIKFNVVGSNAPVHFKNYERVGVQVYGYVPDIEPLFNSNRVFVAPLRFGAGVKGKIGEALSYGLPVVTTAIGAEGMRLEGGKQVLIQNEPEKFAEAILQLYRDRDLWERLADAGYEHIAKYFSPLALEQKIIASISDMF